MKFKVRIFPGGFSASGRRQYPVRVLASGMSTGGAVHGPGTGTSDSIHKMMSVGEFVMTAAAVQAHGPKKMAELVALNLSTAAKGPAPTTAPHFEGGLIGEAEILRTKGKFEKLHITTDAPTIIGSRLGFQLELGEASIKVNGKILATGRDLTRRGTDVAILDYVFQATPPAPKPVVLGVHDDPRPFKTTPMELVMTALRLQGLSVKEIAKKLNVGPHYVKNTNRAVYDKIGGDQVRNHIELALYAQEDGGVLKRAADFALQEWERKHPRVERERVA